MATIKEEAQKVIQKLPDGASWDDVMYEIYVRKKIDEGIKAADAGNLIPHAQVKKRFLRK